MQMIVRHMPEHDVESLYEKHRAELCHYVYHKAGLSKSQAEDVVHTAFEKLVKGKTDIASISNPRAYLYKSCLNLAVDIQRSGSVRQKYVEQTTLETPEEYSDVPGPEASANASQQLKIVSSTIKMMAAKRRKYLLMNRIDGLSYCEIGRREGISEAAVRKHIAKALLECHNAITQGRG